MDSLTGDVACLFGLLFWPFKDALSVFFGAKLRMSTTKPCLSATKIDLCTLVGGFVSFGAEIYIYIYNYIYIVHVSFFCLFIYDIIRPLLYSSLLGIIWILGLICSVAFFNLLRGRLDAGRFMWWHAAWHLDPIWGVVTYTQCDFVVFSETGRVELNPNPLDKRKVVIEWDCHVRSFKNEGLNGLKDWEGSLAVLGSGVFTFVFTSCNMCWTSWDWQVLYTFTLFFWSGTGILCGGLFAKSSDSKASWTRSMQGSASRESALIALDTAWGMWGKKPA